jgi:hypothetical protein
MTRRGPGETPESCPSPASADGWGLPFRGGVGKPTFADLRNLHGLLSASMANRCSRPIPTIHPSRNTVTGMTATPPIAEVRDSLVTRLLKRVFDIDMQLCPTCGAGEQDHCTPSWNSR